MVEDTMARHATGSVYQRASDGRWVASVSLAGRRIVRYGDTEKEAHTKLVGLQREYYAGTLTRPTMVTLGEWIDLWLQQREPELRPSTLRTYRLVLLPLANRIGQVRLDKLTPSLITGGLSELRRKGMGARRVQMAHAYLRVALRHAVQQELIGQNPCDRVSKPRYEPQERSYWDQQQMQRFLSVALASPRQHAALLAFLLGSGLRFGEAIGLRWADVDVTAGTVAVRRAIVWEGNTKASVQKPKTKQGGRTVSLPEFCVGILARLPRPIDGESPVYLTRSGTTPSQSVVGETLRQLCDEAGIPALNVHGLRHCHAALLLAEGVDLQVLRRRLGHATVNMSMAYTYAVRGDGDAARRVSEALASGT